MSRRRLAALVGDAGPDAAPVRLTDSLGRVVRAGWPWAGSGHGRLPALLVGLTVVTGLGHPGRRLIAVTAMFAGALLGALLVSNIDLVLPLAIAAALIAASALAAAGLDRD